MRIIDGRRELKVDQQYAPAESCAQTLRLVATVVLPSP